MMSIMKLLLDIPKTIYFNFKVFPFRVACKLPVRVDYRTRFGVLHKGSIELPHPVKRFIIYFGSEGSKGIDEYKGFIQVKKSGKVIFGGKAYFALGSSVRVDSGKLVLGANFSANRNCFFSCSEYMEFGEDVVLGWNVNVRDSDGHTIYYKGQPKKNTSPVYVGSHVWIASCTDILKGSQIKHDSVVAYRSCVIGEIEESNVLIGGYPAKIIQREIEWEV